VSQDRLPPPEGEACLVRLRPSSQKGGTIVAEDVTELATHEVRLSDPDGYRPAFCPGCRGTTLHIHDYREKAGRLFRPDPFDPAKAERSGGSLEDVVIDGHSAHERSAIRSTGPRFAQR